MRIVLLIAVILLFVDAFFYSGAYTQAAYTQLESAANRLVGYISDTVDVVPDVER